MHEILRKQLIDRFIDEAAMSALLSERDEVPGCFGTHPQGNESAWAQGCKECALSTDSDACHKATHAVREAERERETKMAFIVEDGPKCIECKGTGIRTSSGGRAQRCYTCHGTGHSVNVCPKCKATSGNDWSQCKGDCVMKGSPHYHRYALKTDGRGPYILDREVDAPIDFKTILERLNQK